MDTLNNDVISGKPFRMAYQDLGKSIEEGQYVPNRKIKHTHIGSIGNLSLDKIKEKIKPFLS